MRFLDLCEKEVVSVEEGMLDASGVPLLLTVCTIVSAAGAAIMWCAVQTKKHAAC